MEDSNNLWLISSKGQNLGKMRIQGAGALNRLGGNHGYPWGLAGGGESNSARKTQLRRLRTKGSLEIYFAEKANHIKKEDQPITFNDEDTKGVQQPHDDPLVIIAIIANFITKLVLVESGSSADIIYD